MDSLDAVADADDVVFVIVCELAAFPLESFESTDFNRCDVEDGLDVRELDCFRFCPASGESLLGDDAGFGWLSELLACCVFCAMTGDYQKVG